MFCSCVYAAGAINLGVQVWGEKSKGTDSIPGLSQFGRWMEEAWVFTTDDELCSAMQKPFSLIE